MCHMTSYEKNSTMIPKFCASSKTTLLQNLSHIAVKSIGIHELSIIKMTDEWLTLG